ncbi:trigger factor-like protein TIG, Chloroplastic [Dorcoceras hygrometricum]|nr:trigger factor-like protein TIG, Chloroplastic [Dorcoceras hygrometricum]
MEFCSSTTTTTQTFFPLKSAAAAFFSSSHSLPNAQYLKPLKGFHQSSFTTSPHRFIHPKNLPCEKVITRFVASAAAATVDSAVADKLPADIQVTETPEPNSRVRLSVEVPAAVPGFRPGKNVPEDILIGYVGKEIVKKAIVESILERTLPHAMSSVSGRAFEDSIRIATKFPEMENAYASLKSLRYDVIVDVAPELKWIPDDGYKHLKIVVDIDKEIDAVTAAEQELRRRLKALGALRIVTDRGLEIGDVAILDISATTIELDESTPKTVPSAESKDFQFDTEDGDRVLPGFLNSITGIKRGETKTFPYVFPDSWKQEDLRGVCAQFTVKRILLQKFLELEQTAKEQATDNAILDQLHKMVEVEIPPSLFEEQGRQIYGAQLLQIQANRKLDEKQLASLSSPKAVKNFLENNRENITSIIKQNLAVGDIFKRENLQILTDELVKEVENSIAEFKSHDQEYDEERIKAQVQEVLEGAKVLEWLRQRADIEYITK